MVSIAGINPASGALASGAGPTPREDAHACIQCGLPLGRRPVRALVEESELSFCCNGCLWVARLVGQPGERAVARGLVLRLGLALFFALNCMVFSLAHYGNVLGGEADSESALRLLDVQRWAQLVLALPVLVILGGPTLARLPDVFRGRPAGLDGLVAVGASAAFALSAVNTLRGSGAIYFDTAVMLLVLVTLGKALEATARARAVEAWSRLRDQSDEPYAVGRGEEECVLPADDLLRGDRVQVPAGREIPVDGVIEEGCALISTEWLTGESAPREHGVGDQVLAGAVPVDGPLRIVAHAVGNERRREKLRELLEQARARRPRLVHLADRLASGLLPITLVVAGLAFALGWMVGGPIEASRRAVATLVVACPCALGIAAPLAYWSAWSSPAREGIWLRGADVVERLAGLRAVAIDKTGTLTESRPRLRAVRLVDAPVNATTQEEALALAAGLERGVPHPMAHAIREAASRAIAFDELRLVPGRGVQGQLQGSCWRLGSPRFMREHEIVIPASLRGEREADEELTRLFLARDGQAVAAFELEERIRFGAGPARRGLEDLGLHAIVLSGDSAARTQAVAQRLGLKEAHGDLLPEDKLRHLETLASRGPVAMVGDGLNDAPALGAAAVGFALGESADLTRAAAHVAAPGASPAVVPALIRHARRARRIVLQNFAWAAGYNVIGLGLAASGRLHPIAAATLMLSSSVLVVANSQRLRNFPHIPQPPLDEQLQKDA